MYSKKQGEFKKHTCTRFSGHGLNILNIQKYIYVCLFLIHTHTINTHTNTSVHTSTHDHKKK